MSNLDFSSEFGQRALHRLENEEVIWLVTTAPDGTPQPSPVWFRWDDGEVEIYSRPHTPKLRAIESNPRVALHFNSTASGDDVVVFRGIAAISSTGIPANHNHEYLAKYALPIARLGYIPEQFGAEYSIHIRIKLEALRGF